MKKDNLQASLESIKHWMMDEVKYCFWVVVIIAFGMIWCDLGNREALWQKKYQNWVYNTDCPTPDGFSKAIIDPDKCN